MKLASATIGGLRRLGVIVADDSAVALLPQSLGTLDDVVRGGPAAMETVRGVTAEGPAIPLADVQLGPPLRRFNRDILCTGWNYWDHFEESKGKREGQDPPEPPKHPTFFTKGPDTVIGPADDIAYDCGLSTKWDYEAEVALIIGRDGRSIPEEHAWLHVFGFCVANDISQRDLQRAHGGQWLKGKSIDATMPLGPWITTTDEIDDPYGLRIQCEVNGEILQDASTKQMAFRFERLIAELSRGMTLRAGDVLLTGTPSGIGNARDPQIFLGEGDVVVTRVSGLGMMRNRLSMAGLAAAHPGY
ncbi:fumarylacetoacetate hydrolase family protein [Streptomyces platensis]|uniref:fumarylacetoacetate hydrolase family protein n=1 Tax=Streptomyces platensis TaxID=58346 RepID=UPI001F3A267B|nr:fumarylacetoacetate hydrolase family protein [Streptomyces platensis]MCF3142240.1 fumarylacetoacetate hydrolase family protein [Streptomyces platensis]